MTRSCRFWRAAVLAGERGHQLLLAVAGDTGHADDLASPHVQADLLERNAEGIELRQRQVLDRQHHIQGFLGLRAEMQLPGQAHAVGLVARFQLRVQPVRWPKERHPQGLAEALEAVAQRRQRAMRVQPLAQGFQHPRAGLRAVQGLQLVPDLLPCVLDGEEGVPQLVGDQLGLAHRRLRCITLYRASCEAA